MTTDEGLRLEKAMTTFALASRDLIKYAAETWRIPYRQPRSFNVDPLLRDIADGVANGTLRIRARLSHEMEFRWLAREFLLDATANLASNEIRSGDLRFVGIRVFASDAAQTYRTGVVGRPSSKHLWLEKLDERLTNGLAASSLKTEANWLANWLVEEHPDAAPATWKTIQEDIRSIFRKAQSKPGMPENLP